ncbi:MAG: hypothetical protein ACYTHN_20230, partial [Planctomycetota bacterium]
KGDAFDPQLAVDRSGRVHAVFVSNGDGPYDLWHAVLAGKAWKKPKNVTKGSVRKSARRGLPMNSMAPRLCAMKDGRLALVWYTWGEARMGARRPLTEKEWPWKEDPPPKVRDRDLFVSFTEGGEFSKPLLISDKDMNGAQDHTDPAIARHPDGGAYIAWSCDHPECFMEVFRGSRIFGHTLGRHVGGREVREIEPVSPVGSTRVRYPEVSADLACTALGDLWAVWDSTMSRGRPAHRVFASKWGKEGFGEPHVISEGDDIYAPRAFSIGETALVLWEKLSKGGTQIFASRIEEGKPSLLAAGKQPFIAFRAGTAWLAFASRSRASTDIYVCSREVK